MSQAQFTFAHRFDQVSGSAIREIFKVIAQPGMISFAGGNPSPDALPDDTVRLLSDEVLREKGKILLQYGATEGYPPFIESLLKYVRDMLKCLIYLCTYWELKTESQLDLPVTEYEAVLMHGMK